MIVDEIRVIDSDSHVVERPDLWNSAAPSKWREIVPHVEVHPESGGRLWRIGDAWLSDEAQFAFTGSTTYPPLPPRPLDHEDVDRGSYEPVERLKRMDEYGISAQLLYPNIIGFALPLILKLGTDVALWTVRHWNDSQVEFASADPKRLLPMTMLPFWDVEESVKEMYRCRELGHKGVVFSNRVEDIGLPPFHDPHWDPLYAVAQDLDVAINFHVGFGRSPEKAPRNIIPGDPRRTARLNTTYLMSNSETIADALTTGLFDRFPTLKLVSVESGFGYVPYLLESLDWHWYVYGAHREYPTPPSELFRQHCYGTFWFEIDSAVMLEQYQDNFMFSTDFPHNTSTAPGPAAPGEIPRGFLERQMAKVPPAVRSKVLHDNAASLYHLDG